MPFDPLEPAISDLLAAIDRAAALLSAERRWCRRQEISATGQRCLIGALKDAGHADRLIPAVLRAANRVTGFPYARLDLFNDDLLTSHRHVLAALADAHREILGWR
jgi:hypothetical protein